MKYTKEQYYRIWLCNVESIGARRVNQLIDKYGSAEQVWKDYGPHMQFIGQTAYEALGAARKAELARSLMEKLEEEQISVIFRGTAGYPPLLADIADPPLLLYVKGRVDLSDPLTLAMVGARNCTQYGAKAARGIAAALTGAGVTVVSGFARGIDSAAHQGAVEAKGRTIAILGCGVDVMYPPENGELFDQILACDGSVVSEYGPGIKPLAGHFPVRNRLISGMSRGVVVVEAAKGSGAMITVDHALEQGREVYVVPGPIHARLSEMPNRLSREGARVIASAEDLLEDLGLQCSAWQGKDAAADEVKGLTSQEQLVYDALRDGESSVDELVARTGLSAQDVNSVLTMLGIRGIIEDKL